MAGIPGGPDAVVMLLSYRQPRLAGLVVTTAVLGASAGQMFRYTYSRKAGAFALRRFEGRWRERVHRALDSHGAWTIFLANVAPPPFPMSLFTMAAGAFRLRVGAFLLGVVPGRIVRYGLAAWLGIAYGERAGAIFGEHAATIAGVLIGIALGAILVGLRVRARRRRPDAPVGEPAGRRERPGDGPRGVSR